MRVEASRASFGCSAPRTSAGKRGAGECRTTVSNLHLMLRSVARRRQVAAGALAAMAAQGKRKRSPLVAAREVETEAAVRRLEAVRAWVAQHTEEKTATAKALATFLSQLITFGAETLGPNSSGAILTVYTPHPHPSKPLRSGR